MNASRTYTAVPPLERFWKFVEVTDGCWEWTGCRTGDGYGRFSRGRSEGVVNAHRFVYEALVGEVPRGWHVDHLCRNSGCVRPEHLEAVTPRENTLRGLRGRLVTQCPQGHPYDEKNTHVAQRKQGGTSRNCRACNREKLRQLRLDPEYRRQRCEDERKRQLRLKGVAA